MFERQGIHLVFVALLVAGAAAAGRLEGMLAGACCGLPTAAWYWLSILFPIVHQVFVALCWRLELHGGRLGMEGFSIYAAGFALFSFCRILTLILLAVANAGSLGFPRAPLIAVAAVIAVPAAYAVYSVARYFGTRRALGLDHFDPAYRDKPFVNKGIFRFVRNGMYTCVIPALFIPGLLAASKAALVSALFSNLYIWVHYYCTELPDIRRIYGSGS